MRLIDANALSYQIGSIPATKGHEKAWVATERDINKAPTVDPEAQRPKGVWGARVMENITKYTVYWCSRCNRVSYFKSNYCPNCGAKMEG